MIHVNITGGLGNQLFQYAFARSIQELTGQDIALNIYELARHDRKRKLELDRFRLNKSVSIECKKLPWYVHRRSYVGKFLRSISRTKYFKFCLSLNSYVWYGSETIKIPKITSEDDIYIGGYWQSPEYSERVVTKLSKELRLKEKEALRTKESRNEISENPSSVCVHVRRGDYVGTEYEVCNADYYREAMDIISEKIKDPTFYVFSDDMIWAKENFDQKYNVKYMDGANTAFEDLDLMMACHHFVISNSTFSWWAQYLSNSYSKIVIAPSLWNRKVDSTYLYLKTWTVLNVD